MNASLNNTAIAHRADELVGRDDGWQVILAGDMFYDQSLAADLIPWFDALSTRGATVLIGDPGRAYCPRQRLKLLATCEVPVVRELEDADVKRTHVWQFV